MGRHLRKTVEANPPRSSLARRVSIYYAWMLLVMAIPQIILFVMIYSGITAFQLAPPFREAISRAKLLSLPAATGVYASVFDGEGNLISTNLPEAVGEDWLARDSINRRDYVNIYTTITFESGDAGAVRVSLDITERVTLLYGMLAALAVLNILWAVSCVRFGRRASDRLFKPIRDITDTAQSLSENNLNQRINVEGINTELKDMAVVINDMLDRIEQAYNSQKVFVSDASHELRTPIAVIQGYAEMLDRWGKQEPEIRDEAIAAILSESRGMQSLVEKLLFIARHDKNAMEMNREFFDAAELADELARETALIAGGRQVLIGKMQSAILSADRALLKQALRIFVENAIKYTKEGDKITLSCTSEGEQCRISVEDTGMGIAPEELKKVFDRFYRSDPARLNGSQGHGLGLAIARLIVSAHGGKIEVKSKQGKGSKFCLILPM